MVFYSEKTVKELIRWPRMALLWFKAQMLVLAKKLQQEWAQRESIKNLKTEEKGKAPQKTPSAQAFVPITPQFQLIEKPQDEILLYSDKRLN
jgi:hypothetical protein